MTVRSVLLLPLLGLAALLCDAGQARADTITYEFTGEIYEVVGMPSGSFADEDAVSGTLTLRDGISDSRPDLSNWGRYLDAASFTLSTDTGSWSGDLRADVKNLPTGDVFAVATGPGNAVSGTSFGTSDPSQFGIDDVGPATIFDSHALEELFDLTLSDWPSMAGFLGFSGGGYIRFNVGTLSAVPEPATLTLFGLGAAGLACVLRRRRHRVR